jgi:16S rRNA processing protein RimM
MTDKPEPPVSEVGAGPSSGVGAPPLLEVGVIVKPHGLRGEVVVQLVTNRLERLEPGTILVCTPPLPRGLKAHHVVSAPAAGGPPGAAAAPPHSATEQRDSAAVRPHSATEQRDSAAVRPDGEAEQPDSATEQPDSADRSVRFPSTVEVVDSRPHQGRHLVRFAGITTIEQADALRGAVLHAEPIDDPAAYFVHDLIGCELVDVHGVARGTVTAVEANPASDLLVVDERFYVPLRFVTERRPGRLVVDVPDGLFD